MQQAFTILLLCAVAMTYFLSYHLSSHFHEARIRARVIEKRVCLIPDPDPFDPAVMEYFKRHTLHCSDDPFLTYLNDTGFLHINKTGLRDINRTFETVHCSYKSVSTVKGFKDKLQIGPEIIISKRPTKINSDYIVVICTDDYHKTIYATCHFQVALPNKHLRYKNRKVKTEGRPNVLLLGIDSVSRLSFIRNLPKSYKFLLSRLQPVVMKGLNKVGKDTHSNMIPFLSGYRFFKKKGDPNPAACDGDNCNIYFDHLPIVWHNFSRAGYVTMFLDEWSSLQLFYYSTKGFMKTPTDYFPRPLIQCFEALGLNSRGPCYGNTPTHDIVLNYTQKFVEAMKDTVYFSFSFISRISHNDDFEVQALDDSLTKTMEKLFYNGHLKNTIFVLFGDHGRRFGKIRKTTIGALEDRMPFLSIYLPRKLRDNKPHLQAALEANSGELLSWFDMYEMLMDLAMENLEVKSRVLRWGYVNGLSPLRPLPPTRTCHEAGVPAEYCVCTAPLQVPMEDEWVFECAHLLLDHLNQQLMGVPGQPCAQLTLGRVEAANVFSQEATDTSAGHIKFLSVTVIVLPSAGQLEATFQSNAYNSTWEIIGEVERLNSYSHQAHCVETYPDVRIHPYCYCNVQQDLTTVKGRLGEE